MTKPALFFTLQRAWHVGGFHIVRVTTVKRHRRTGEPTHYYGTNDDGNTHCKASQCVGEFPTYEAAQAMIERVARVRAAHADNIAILQAALVQAQRDEREAVDNVVMGVEPSPPQSPVMMANRAQAKGPEACKRLARYS